MFSHTSFTHTSASQPTQFRSDFSQEGFIPRTGNSLEALLLAHRCVKTAAFATRAEVQAARELDKRVIARALQHVNPIRMLAKRNADLVDEEEVGVVGRSVGVGIGHIAHGVAASRDHVLKKR